MPPETNQTNEKRPAVIVTGSAGMLGFPVCRALADRGYEVFGFDRVGPPEPPRREHVTDLEFDVTEFGTVRAAFEDVKKRVGNKLASVVHLAAYYDFSGEDSPLYEKVTVNGTDRILNHLHNDFDLEQFVFSSTMLVHKPVKPGEYIKEDSPLEAKWPYPKSKIETEKLIRDGHPDVKSVLLRIAGVYTDWGSQPTLAQQIKRIYEKDLQSHLFPGDLRAGQAVVHLEDAVDAIVRTVDRRNDVPDGTPILIGEPDPPSYGELQDALGELIHGKEHWTTLKIPAPVAKAGAWAQGKIPGQDPFIKPFMISMADDHYALDISRARELLGWQPTRNLRDVLPTIVEHLKNDPAAFYKKNKLGTPPS